MLNLGYPSYLPVDLIVNGYQIVGISVPERGRVALYMRPAARWECVRPDCDNEIGIDHLRYTGGLCFECNGGSGE